jgi:Na+-transporting NADH:ubiquinone oxidoreductase subunit B
VRLNVNAFIFASLPAALIGVWNLGAQLKLAPPSSPQPWQLAWLEVGFGTPESLPAVVLGAAFFLPLLFTALVVSRVWAELFAKRRDRPLDSGWAVTAWLFTLLLPASMPLPYAVLCLSFGVVFGGHVFGGTGRYLVNPALLGIVFAAIAYPHLVADTQWLPGASVPSSWAIAAAGDETSVAGGLAWFAAFFGSEIGAIGTSSDCACLLGVAFLIARGAASVRVVAAALAGVAVAGALIGELPWYWHLALGNFVFVLAFVATDPTTRPVTNGGCIAFGALLGMLTIVLRMGNPAHPDGAWFALLLASLFVPLLDHIAKASARSPPIRAAQ